MHQMDIGTNRKRSLGTIVIPPERGIRCSTTAKQAYLGKLAVSNTRTLKLDLRETKGTMDRHSQWGITMSYSHSVSSLTPSLHSLSELLLDVLSEHAKPWWSPLAAKDILGFDEPQQQDWWDRASATDRARWLIDRLWHYQERLPWEFCDTLELPRASTYAQTVRRLWRDLLEEDSTGNA